MDIVILLIQYDSEKKRYIGQIPSNQANFDRKIRRTILETEKYVKSKRQVVYKVSNNTLHLFYNNSHI